MKYKNTKLCIQTYKDFCKEIDEYVASIICELSDITWIYGEQDDVSTTIVGMMCTINGYIDCIYVYPEYRRKGYAKQTVIEWYENNKDKFHEITLHIINNNTSALKFWYSIFRLSPLNTNGIDTLYKISGIKH